MWIQWIIDSRKWTIKKAGIARFFYCADRVTFWPPLWWQAWQRLSWQAWQRLSWQAQQQV
jgi:hypothetical protein